MNEAHPEESQESPEIEFMLRRINEGRVESSKQINIIRICDGCGARDNVILGHGHNDEWATEGDEDYCPDCSYYSCANCECEPDYPETDHQTNCKRMSNQGNCTCPPCGCDCHI